MSLKIGGNDVGKLMYGNTEVSGGSQMLESGTIVYQGVTNENIHLLSVDDKWTNISQLRILERTSSGIAGDYTVTTEQLSNGSVIGNRNRYSKNEVNGKYYLHVEIRNGYTLVVSVL